MSRRKLDLSTGVKNCPRCKETKPLNDFHKSCDTLHGYQVYCKPCQYERHNDWRLQNLTKMAEDQKRRRHADPERFKDYARKAAYGMPYGEYERMLATQNGRCAICATTVPGGKGQFHVDHCHIEKSVRGLLCHHCNLGIGNFKHDVTILLNAISYLTEAGREGRS